MRSICTIALIAMFTAGAAAAQNAADPTKDKNKLSYAMGYQMGLQLRYMKLDLDLTAVQRGVSDAQNKDKEPLVPREEMVTIWETVEKRVRADQKDQIAKIASDNLKKSRQFLAENKAKKGIQTLPSGVQYREIEEGTGPKPTTKDTVVINFRGSLIDGHEFASTFAKGTPVTVDLSKIGDVMKGWEEIIPMMKEGAKWQVFVPPELGFGEHGAMMENGPVAPNEVLIFDIQLVQIRPTSGG